MSPSYTQAPTHPTPVLKKTLLVVSPVVITVDGRLVLSQYLEA